MRYFFFKNSNEHAKNMFQYAENFVQGGNPNSPYQFMHSVSSLFHATLTGNSLNIIHKLADPLSFASEIYPYKSFFMDELAGIMDTDESVHLVAVDLGTTDSDVTLLSRARLGVVDKDGAFLDPKTRKPLSENDPTASVLLFSGFKVGPAPFYVFVFHMPFVEARMGNSGGDYIYRRLLENQSIKSSIYPLKAVSGVEATVGNNILFANSNSVQFQAFDLDVVNPLDVNLNNVVTRIDCKYPVKVDATGVVTLDLSTMPANTSTPLMVVFDGGPYLNYWINLSQRFVYEYMIYKTV